MTSAAEVEDLMASMRIHSGQCDAMIDNAKQRHRDRLLAQERLAWMMDETKLSTSLRNVFVEKLRVDDFMDQDLIKVMLQKDASRSYVKRELAHLMTSRDTEPDMPGLLLNVDLLVSQAVDMITTVSKQEQRVANEAYIQDEDNSGSLKWGEVQDTEPKSPTASMTTHVHSKAQSAETPDRYSPSPRPSFSDGDAGQAAADTTLHRTTPGPVERAVRFDLGAGDGIAQRNAMPASSSSYSTTSYVSGPSMKHMHTTGSTDPHHVKNKRKFWTGLIDKFAPNSANSADRRRDDSRHGLEYAFRDHDAEGSPVKELVREI